MRIDSKLRLCARRNGRCCQILCIFSFFIGLGFIIGGSYLTDKYANNYNCFDDKSLQVFSCQELGEDQIYFDIGVALLVFGILLLVASALVLCCFYGIPEVSKQISKNSAAYIRQAQMQINLLPSGSCTNTVGLSIPSLPQVDSQINLSQQSIMYTAPYPSEIFIPQPFPSIPPTSDQSTNFSSTQSVPEH
ncbi:unnamed protein product [Hymenolepis diminuta]|uniref:Uncharacterized protein n=1 Tax=Hymenolepis diminuta TaxID=6216 RepID=A0A564XYY1_HYMDI|nr:unnamed protein product [Hymenolepis diminuta]